MSARVLASAFLAILLPFGAGAVTTSGAATEGAEQARAADATIGVRILGESVRGRKIRAYHLGEPGKQKVVLISTMHGNEARTRRILLSLKNGASISGVTTATPRSASAAPLNSSRDEPAVQPSSRPVT